MRRGRSGRIRLTRIASSEGATEDGNLTGGGTHTRSPEASRVGCAIIDPVVYSVAALAAPLGHAAARAGRVVAAGLDRAEPAAQRSAVAARCPAAGEHVLDVGFGGGVGLGLLPAGPAEQVVGVEHSADIAGTVRDRRGRRTARAVFGGRRRATAPGRRGRGGPHRQRHVLLARRGGRPARAAPGPAPRLPAGGVRGDGDPGHAAAPATSPAGTRPMRWAPRCAPGSRRSPSGPKGRRAALAVGRAE